MLPAVHQGHDSPESPGNFGKGLENLFFPFFDALGDLHLPLPGEERDHAHLFQIKPHRVIQLGTGLRVQSQVPLRFLHFYGGGQGQAVGNFPVGEVQFLKDQDIFGRFGDVTIGREGIIQIVYGNQVIIVPHRHDFRETIHTHTVAHQLSPFVSVRFFQQYLKNLSLTIIGSLR